MKALEVMIACSVCLLALTAQAQDWDGEWSDAGYYHASTAAESYQRGFADVVRSAGAANLMNSEAAKNYEEARAKFIQNRLAATRTYFEIKRVNHAYRRENMRPRPTSEQLFRLAKEALPDALTSAQLDPVTGEINWPVVLRSDVYRESREALNRLFAERAGASEQISFERHQEIRSLIHQIQSELRKNLRGMPPQSFTEANSFLKRLRFEVIRPGGPSHATSG